MKNLHEPRVTIAALAPKTGLMIAALREEKGWTQVELARELRVTRSYVGTAERGMTRLSEEFVRSVVDVLELDAGRGILLLQTFTDERGLVVTKGLGEHVQGALVAAIERTRRKAGKRAVCPDCGAGTRQKCVKDCGKERAV